MADAAGPLSGCLLLVSDENSMKSNNPIIDLSSHSLNEIDESIALCENLVVICSVMMD